MVRRGLSMRVLGYVAVAGLLGVAAFQSILGGAPIGSAKPETLSISAADICPVDAMTVPVIRRETRAFTVMPAHKALSVTPAKFGTRTEELVVVPEHREGATFFTEPKRVIATEPTRRLRVIEPEFESVAGVTGTVTRARVEGGILITDSASLDTGPDMKIVVGEARIQAVRLNAGLKMHEIKIIDTDGDGELVPAQTTSIEVRTVEAHPAVETTDIAAVVEQHEVEVVETPARKVEVDAYCAIMAQPALITDIQAVLDAKGIASGEPGVWSPATIDAIAAAQAKETDLVSPYLLLETLQKWLPEVELPTS